LLGVSGDRAHRHDGDFSIDAVIAGRKSGDGADRLAEPSRVHAGADGFHSSGSFVADLGRQLGLDQIPAQAEHDFGAVEADRLHAQTNLSGGRLRQRQFIDLEDFRASGLMEANDLDDSWGFS
jgi:hypothetical protein